MAAAALGGSAAADAATRRVILELPDAGGAQAVALGDVTGDGRPDVVAAGRSGPDADGRLWIAQGDGAGGLRSVRGLQIPEGDDVEVVDVTRDGVADVVVAAGSELLVVKGRSLEVVSRLRIRGLVSALAVGDVTGDGIPDALVDSSEGRSTGLVLRGDGVGRFVPTSGRFAVPACIRGPDDVLLRDFNQDGATDIAVVNFCEATVTTALNGGPAGFPPGPTLIGPTYAVAFGDLDGDGRVDAIGSRGGKGSGLAMFFRGNGDGSFTSVSGWADRRGLFDLATADFDGDGLQDVVASQSFDAGPHHDDRGFTFLLGDGNLGVRRQVQIQLPLSKNVYDLAIGDVSGDGRPDVAGVLNTSATRGQLVLLSRIDTSGPLTAASGPADVRVARSTRVAVELAAPATVTVELAPRGGRAVQLARVRLPAGSHRVRIAVPHRSGRRPTMLGSRRLVVTARRGSVFASQRLPIILTGS